ncbi:MAG TPA: acetoacetate--CoA ligase [Steroidobacteraceae bacterium]|nr:acetoacetate--CoA ligase [Steroidobacteraceae bacterium]
MNQTPPLWQPSPGRVAASNLSRFHTEAVARGAPREAYYPALWRWSVDRREDFWAALADFAEVVWERGTGPVLQQRDRMPGAVWFADTRLNFAENLLARRDDHAAVVFVNERGTRRELSYRELHAEVARIAAGLRDLGLRPGDRVAGFLPNLPEALVAMLATTSLGAVWTSCSPDFGIHGVLDRFGQVEPRVLFTADGYYYGGKTLDSLGPIRGVLEHLPSVERVVVIPYLEAGAGTLDLPHVTPWHDFGRAGADLSFERVPFDAPLYVMYSSGTTGVPKCIVHGVGGTLLQHRKEHLLHCDLKPDDRLFFFTTCGWMMWNWLASGLATGCTLVLYDGSPFAPDRDVLWRLAQDERVTHFGTSPKYLAALQKEGGDPARDFDLAALRVVLSTGSPLAPEQFDFVYEHVKRDVHLASISGGTDIISCFALGNPWQAVRRGELQGPGLGMQTEVYDDDGNAVVETQGELVCSAPFPSMPIGFWNDPDGRKYRAAYFERFENVWHHGDYALQTRDGGFVILGRSDAVLNPGGVRIGTAEIYRQVEKLDEILESLAIGQEWEHDVRVVLFVRLRQGVELDAALEKRIRDVIRSNTTPRHVPARIVAVPDIPRTISGKIVELAVRETVHGRPVKNTDALANPAALEHFRNRDELRR